jgi:hypothetical protein
MITEAKKEYLTARQRLPGYAAYVQAAADWHAFDSQKARERNFTVQSVEERAKVPEYQAYLKVKDAFDAEAKQLPEYAAMQADKRRYWKKPKTA